MLEEHDLPEGLRNRVWNVLWELFFSDEMVEERFDEYSVYFSALSEHLRHSYFKLPVDDRSNVPTSERSFLRARYFELQFPDFYDFLEEMAGDKVASIIWIGRDTREKFGAYTDNLT